MTDLNTAMGAARKAALMNSTAMMARQKSGRPQRLSAKAAHRRDLPKPIKSFSYAGLADDPIYRRIAKADCPKDLSAEITRLGFETAADVAACKSVPVMQARMSRAVDGEQIDDAEMTRLLSRSKREALRGYRLMRHAMSVNDPMNQGLRHTASALSFQTPVPALDVVHAYAHPRSLQSNQSLAAYLRYLYRIATGRDQEIGILSVDDSPYALANRRPDLADLVLNQANLKKEVPTIELVNEVLRAGLWDIDMGRHYYPVALPYDHAVTTTRTALAQIGGTTINDIAMQTSRPGMGSFGDHRWANDEAGLLGLLGASDQASGEGGTVSLLTEEGADPFAGPTTLGGLYDAPSRGDACGIDHLMSALGLDFDGFAQLFGLYAVAQENGAAVAQGDFATAFLANDAPIKLEMVGEVKSVQMAGAPLTAPDLRVFNYLARLHHATGLAFHDLNTILALPGAAANVVAEPDDAHRARRRVTGAGLRLLASYPLYRDAFGLTPAGYAALFGEISPYWRADQIIEDDEAVSGLEQTEMSFLASLFKETAPLVHSAVINGTTSIWDEVEDEALASIIARGLGLSALELETLVDVLDDGFGLTKGLNARGLGALYRVATLCQMLDWPLLSGLTLIEKVSGDLGKDPALWTTLIGRNVTEADTDALCSAVDWLIYLSQWMVEAEITPDALIAVLTRAEPGTLQAGDADVTWLEDLSSAFGPLGVSPEIFAPFETWKDAEPITAATWHAHLLCAHPIYHPTGVFLDGLERDAVETACRACLTEAGVDPADADNAAQVQALVSRLVGLRDAQIQMIEAQVAGLDTQVSVVSVAPFILWAQTNALDLLEMLLKGPGDQSALFWLSEIRRHIAVVSAFELGDVELWLLGNHPEWMTPALAGDSFAPRPLHLAQLFWMQRFATLQVAPATDAAWRGYLLLTNGEGPETGQPLEEVDQWIAGSRETLALLIGCPSEDMAVYADALFAPGHVAQDIAQIDLIARHVRLADKLNISARELLALKDVSNSATGGDWKAAAAAAQAGLARFDNGDQVPGFRHRLAEQERDALVAAFMQTRIARDKTLKDDITDSEKLYSYLLLDVNVTSAVPTSRMVEATSSLQLYISRALAGLEQGAGFVDADDFDRRDTLAAQWELDKQYRQWEANQKLLLYPQNYIEPELRVIRSPEFDALQSAVSGGNVSPDSVEAAVNTYMKGLAGACDLSLCSFYAERHTGGDGIENATYHVLAKAKWEPGRFFYRRLDADFQTIAELVDPDQYLKAMDWTYWQEVSIPTTFDLFSDVTVCVFKNRYHFFWLELEERKIQTDDGPKPIWRLHPRYMRCDQNALVGPMLTPGLFLQGGISDPEGTMTIDGAFEWTGEKPVLNGTYHPTQAPDGLVYGKLAASVEDASDETASDESEAISEGTLTVTFGIDLAYDPIITRTKDKAATASTNDPLRTALHIRLSEEWSDAILDLDDALLNIFEDNAPSGYTSIHPRPVNRVRAIADQYSVSATHNHLPNSAGKYKFEKVHVENTYERGTLQSSMTFIPAQKGSVSLGSVDIDLDLGKRIYEFWTDSRLSIKSVEEKAPTKVSVRFILDFKTEEGVADRSTTPWQAKTTDLFKKTDLEITQFYDDGSHGFFEAICSHSTNERFFRKAVLPGTWSFGTETKVTLRITAEIKREFGQLKVVSNSGQGTKSTNDGTTTSFIELGTFTLQPPEGKNNTAWAQTGEHGSRNFMHVTDKESRDLDETFVLLNSSSVLSRLAKTTPRPGGCESLFTLDNQQDEEDLGTFPDNFPAALDKIYLGDDTVLNSGRIPGKPFDFDSAYGAYGWEVFYHIPSAIAGGYAGSGQFDQALRWLRRIFDPQLETPWRVKPLLNASEPQDGLAFDTGDVIIDPDRIAQDYPFYYQQATIRNYLEVLLDAGDAAYEQQTQETLQRAKALYVSAKQLFSDNLSETLESLTNTPWTDPMLGATAEDGYDGFLPPYNEELRSIHATLEARLFNLRHWLDLNGEPLNVPLLAQPIDPQQLQRSAKAKLTRLNRPEDGDDEIETPLDFTYVVRSAKGYLNNLKLTSHRLQDASEKEGDSQMEEFRMDAGICKSNRAIGLQDFAIEAAAMNVAIKTVNLATSTVALTNHVAKNLTKIKAVWTGSGRVSRAVLGLQKSTYEGIATRVSSALKSTIPNTFGFSTGGQNLEQYDLAKAVLNINYFLYSWDVKSSMKDVQNKIDDLSFSAMDMVETAAKVTVDTLELSKASMAVQKEKAMREELETQAGGAQKLRDEWDEVFGGTSFYKPFREDLEALYAEEWAVTQEFCRLLVRLYEDETQQTNGATFLRTISLGSGFEKFNAPHRLALDIERLETAYIQTLLDQASETSEVQFALSEISALGQEYSALDELVEQGEVYFQLTDEMFDLLYPGQYDRRIQSININFSGLAQAGLSPHARLTQVSNTRYLTPDRDRARGAKIRKDRHALQSLSLSASEVDTRSIDVPDGLLQRFQNTGVESCWHLVIPTVQELKQRKTGRGRNRGWRDAAVKRYDALKPHMTEVDFTVRFSGRWSGPNGRGF